MFIYGVLRDIFQRYMLLGPYWKLFTYVLTIIFMKGIVIWSKYKQVQASRCMLIIILFFYLSTVYISTVLARSQMANEVELLPALWSWRKVLSGERYVQYMVIENIIMLMPVGIIFPFIINKNYVTLLTILFGFAFSLFIEVSQKALHVGFFEMDDLMNNTIGVALGCAASIGVKKLVKLKSLTTDINKR